MIFIKKLLSVVIGVIIIIIIIVMLGLSVKVLFFWKVINLEFIIFFERIGGIFF